MKNIWLILIPSFVVYIFLVGAIVYVIEKKEKYRLIKIISCVGMLIFFLVTDFPCYQDIIKKETHIVEAEYIEFQSGNTIPGTRKAFFKSELGIFYIYIPIITRDVSKMETGETYEIEYFYNSRILKEYRLLE